MLENDFRDQVITFIRAVREGMPGSVVHLLYAPESTDPLGLLTDERRDSAAIPAVKGAFGLPNDLVRVVTLDCRRVASYLLETDPALDDPLFEASVTLAYKEMITWADGSTDVASDGSAVRTASVYGWIVTLESARQCVARAANIARPNGHNGELHPMRWYEPEVLASLWPSFDETQKTSLLGDATWFMCGVPPALRRYKAPARSVSAAPTQEITSGVQLLRPEQWQLIFNSMVVSALAGKWHALCAANDWRFPDDAIQQLHRHVQAAQTYGFDADDLAIYVLTAVQLAPDAMLSDEARALLTSSSHAGIPLRDALEDLPDSFWERYGRSALNDIR